MSILIPAAGVSALIDETVTFGARCLETGGFVLAPRADPPTGTRQSP